MMRKTAEADGPVLRLQRLQDSIVVVDIVGLTPIIPHKWAEKALKAMREKQYGTAVRQRREPKNPEEEAESATYWLEDGRPAMPATAFKAALIGACRFFNGFPMTVAKTALYVVGEGPEQLVPINGTISMREDTPRLTNGNPDLRYRNMISDWSATLRVSFITSRVDAESVVALVDAAGRGGIGDWRPASPKSHTGVYGTWRVAEVSQ